MHVHDSTQIDGQGEDIGSQYMSAIFYSNEQQHKIALDTVNNAQESLNKQIEESKQKEGKKIVTLIRELDVFYIAEGYHQNYWNQKGSENPYCNIIPGKIEKMRKYFADKTISE